MRFYLLQLCLVILAILATGPGPNPFALASSGDRSAEFQRCLGKCTRDSCTANNNNKNGGHRNAPPLALRLTRWTCTDECKYACTHAVTDLAMESGLRVEQFYGKWPFWRLAGMQEPASVAFSFANLLMHVLGADWLRRGVHPAHPMRPFYLTWSYVSINAWVWSTVFHTRDTPLTEKLDYFSAGLVILYGLYMTVVRLFHLYPGTSAFPGRPGRTAIFHAWRSLVAIVYCGHVAYLGLLPRFDYSYNVNFNIALGLAHHALWLSFALPGSSPFPRYSGMPRSYRPAHAGTAAVTVALTTAATALEIFDFPPWGRVLDAHALWHFATAPLAVLWYDFLITDSIDAGWKGQRQ